MKNPAGLMLTLLVVPNSRQKCDRAPMATIVPPVALTEEGQAIDLKPQKRLVCYKILLNL